MVKWTEFPHPGQVCPVETVEEILESYTKENSRSFVAEALEKYLLDRALLKQGDSQDKIGAAYHALFKKIVTELSKYDEIYGTKYNIKDSENKYYFFNLFANYRREKSKGSLKKISLAYIWIDRLHESKDLVNSVNSQIFDQKTIAEISKQGFPLTRENAKKFDFSKIKHLKKTKKRNSNSWRKYFSNLIKILYYKKTFVLIFIITVSSMILIIPNSLGNKLNFAIAESLLSGEIRQEFYPDIDYRVLTKNHISNLSNQIGLNLLHVLDDRDFMPATHQLGLRYLNGYYTDYDPKAALKIFRRAEKLGESFALHNIGYQYHYGIGVEVDLDKAVYYYKSAIDLGYAHSYNNLGWLHHTAIGRNYNPMLAERFFSVSYRAGSAMAANNLGLMHKYGSAENASIDTAIKFFKEASDKESPHGKFNLADLYLRGLVKEKDDSDAFKLFQDAAKKGAVRAIVRLGRLKEYGLGLNQPDIQAAKGNYEEAAKLGSGRALWHLGQLYESGKLGEDKSQEAFKWYKKIEVSDDPVVLTILGRHYMNSFIIPDRDEEAKRLFEKAKDRGSAWAASQLAWLYEKGRLGQNERSKAVDEYRFASDRGHAWARYRLGLIYLDPESDLDDALHGAQLLEAAARSHNVFVRRQIARMYRYGVLIESDRNRAYEIYRLTAALADAKSYFHMAEMHGLGELAGEPNASLALENFRNAVELAKFQKDSGFLDEISAGRILRPFLGEGIQHDLANILREASELGSTSAMAAIAALHFDFESASVEEEEAIKWLNLSADQDHAESLTMLIDIYYNRIESIDSKYLHLYINRVRQAAGLGIYSAIKHMKRMGEEALLTKTNEPEWLTAFIRRTESSNFIRDQLEIAKIYRLGIGDVTKQPEKSIIWLERAMTGGSGDARSQLIWQFASGIDGLLDIDRAIELLKSVNSNKEYIFGSLTQIKDRVLEIEKNYNLKKSALNKIKEKLNQYRSQTSEQEIVDGFKSFMNNNSIDD